MMKNLFLFVSFLLCSSLAFAIENDSVAPEFTLETASGEKVSLSDYAGKTVVLEWVNPFCPFVKKFYSVGAMQDFQKKAQEKGVVWISINSTNPDHGDYLNDEATLEYIEDNKIPSIWLKDLDGSVGKLYDAKRTPHMFVISPEGKIVYQGAIDSVRDANPDSIAGAENYVLEAIGGGEFTTETRPYGCSIKY